MSQARNKIVLRALGQLTNKANGRIGPYGSPWPNGTHFGAGKGDWWCSEFYTWAAKSALKPFGGADTVRELKSYFGSAYHTVDSLKDVENARRGDWLAMFNEGHTGMFLAQRSDGKIITLEGNVGNRLAVKVRSIEDISGYGSIRSKIK